MIFSYSGYEIFSHEAIGMNFSHKAMRFSLVVAINAIARISHIVTDTYHESHIVDGKSQRCQSRDITAHQIPFIFQADRSHNEKPTENMCVESFYGRTSEIRSWVTIISHTYAVGLYKTHCNIILNIDNRMSTIRHHLFLLWEKNKIWLRKVNQNRSQNLKISSNTKSPILGTETFQKM